MIFNEMLECLGAHIQAMQESVEAHEKQVADHKSLRVMLGEKVREIESLTQRKESAIKAHNREVELLTKYLERASSLAKYVLPVRQSLSEPLNPELVSSGDLASAVMDAAVNIESVNGRTGIYFLLLDDEIVYIGQSIDIYSRICAHAKDEQKTFTRAAWVPVPKESLTDVESSLIAAFQPSQNRIGYPGAGRTEFRNLAEYMRA